MEPRPDDLAQLSTMASGPAGEDAKVGAERSTNLQAVEGQDQFEQATTAFSSEMPDGMAEEEAPAAPHIAPKSVSERAFEYSIPMQIQGADAGDVQVRMEGDRLSISLASILFLVKARMDSAEFEKLNSSRNAGAYISTDALRTAGFVIGFDPAKARLVMSTK